MKIKDKLHYAFIILISTVLLTTGLFIMIITQNRISKRVEKDLAQTSYLIYKIVKNVFDLNKKTLLSNLYLLDFYVKDIQIDPNTLIQSDAEHYITRLTDFVTIPSLIVNNKPIFEDSVLVDDVARITGGNVSILQLIPQGLLRVSTNMMRTDGTRATQVYIPRQHEIVQTLQMGRIYIDKAFHMSQWHIVAYKPIFYNNEVVGAIHVGIKPDINDLKKHILDIEIGETGHPFVVDTEGILIIAAKEENENVYHLPYIRKMIIEKKDGKVTYIDKNEGPKKGKKIIIYYKYMSEMDWIIASGSYSHEFYGELEAISQVIIISIVIAILVAILISFKVSDNLTRPINFLTDSMNEIKVMEYNFSDFTAIDLIKDRIKSAQFTEDEIGLMTNTFYKMLDELEEAQKKLISKHRMYQEMEIAKKIQTLLLPEIKKLPGFEISANMSPAEEIGGDYYDYSIGPNNQIWYAIGDVCGHGILAGLIMMMAQSSINSIIKAIPDITPLELVNMVNNFLVENIRSRMKMTHFMSLAILVSTAEGKFYYAGKHESFIVYRKQKRKCELIHTEGVWVGIKSEVEKTFRNKSFFLDTGDILLLYTDGLIEAKDKNDDLYGPERVMELIQKNSQMSANDLIEMIMKDVRNFMQTQMDDITLFLIRKS
ncbi:MAG: Cache 3/Cache 2 fusion domain-containing protein [Spirochaetes bacterium]|nr:Cache 3/Cache 2 fusion domain-containing protein [Spirochaetota bacterium]